MAAGLQKPCQREKLFWINAMKQIADAPERAEKTAIYLGLGK
jgi:hypothetical protein